MRTYQKKQKTLDSLLFYFQKNIPEELIGCETHNNFLNYLTENPFVIDLFDSDEFFRTIHKLLIYNCYLELTLYERMNEFGTGYSNAVVDLSESGMRIVDESYLIDYID